MIKAVVDVMMVDASELAHTQTVDYQHIIKDASSANSSRRCVELSENKQH
jgi:hypothetical protein